MRWKWLLLDGALAYHAAQNMTPTAIEVPVNGGSFGPDGCVLLSQSNSGTCMLSTDCDNRDLSKVDFAFVCLNPGSTIPHAIHSFGRGGFAARETFDTEVSCRECATMQQAFRVGSELLNKLGVRTGIGSRETPAPAPEDSPSGTAAQPLVIPPVPSVDKAAVRQGNVSGQVPERAAYYGPKSCVMTFPSEAGSCVIQTRCKQVNISRFDIGVTCMDMGGGYTKYLFGAGAFAQEETFDTRIRCKACLGVADSPQAKQGRGYLPKQLVEDVNAARLEIKQLRAYLTSLREGQAGSASSTATKDVFDINNAKNNSAGFEPSREAGRREQRDGGDGRS